MKHSEFTDKFHWMNGLSEYYRFTGQEERFEPVFKALYHNNYYRKRDIIYDIMESNYYGIETVPVKLKRAWLNMLLHEHLEDVEVKTALITSLIVTVANDPFVNRIAKFIDYFHFVNEGKKGEKNYLPDLGDFLSRGQVKSKLWLVTELSKIVEGSLGNVVFYGGWYNFLAHFIFDQFKVKKLYTLDLDEEVVEPSNILYGQEVMENRFFPMVLDVNKLRWNSNRISYVDHEKRIEQIDRWMEKQEEKYASEIETKQDEIKQGYTSKEKIREDIFKDKDDLLENKFGWVDLDSVNLVINTSCEHMDTTWFDNLPEGTFVVLQQNDYFENEQHMNCCKDLEDVKKKYPMQSIHYEGELDTNLYNRFMIIGVK